MTEESVRVRNAARREYWTAWFAAQTGAPRFTAQALWYNARGNPQTLREIVKLWEHRTIYDAVLDRNYGLCGLCGLCGLSDKTESREHKNIRLDILYRKPTM